MTHHRLLAMLLLVPMLALSGCQGGGPQPAPTATATNDQTPAPAGTAQLAIITDPPGAQVSVDGQVEGSSPITLTLAAGVRQVAVSAPGFAPLTEPITLAEGQQGIYSPTLEDVAPPAITIDAQPQHIPWLGEAQLQATAKDNRAVADLQIVLNGQVLGDTDAGELAVEFSPSLTAGLVSGKTYTLTARATDEAGNSAEALLPLFIDDIRAATPAGGATAQPSATPGTPAAARTATHTPRPAAQATATEARPTVGPQASATPFAGEPTTYRIDSVIIPTYPYSRFLSIVPDPKVSDYPVLVLDRNAYDASDPQPVPVSYTLIVLENRYVKLSLLPDLGGRLYECIFKPTGSNEFYQNPVIKPSLWGPGGKDRPGGANWWLAVGGLEWAFPVEEHGYDWAKSWGYDFYHGDDGSATVTVFSRDYQRPYVAVAITLPPDSAAFTVHPRIVNPLGAPFRFKWWDTAMLAPGPANKPGADLRFILPGNEVTVHSTGGGDQLPAPGQAMPWPVYAGRDMSRLGNWISWLGFFARPAAQADFAGVYDTASDEGMVRIFPKEVTRGVKGFGMGWSAPLDPSAWTDDGSSYVELHGGLGPTFDDWIELPPGGQVNWDETWYPAAGAGGVVYANERAALNVSRSGNKARVALFPTAPLTGRLQITLPGLPPAARQVNIGPDRPFNEEFTGVLSQGQASVTLTGDAGQEILKYNGALR